MSSSAPEPLPAEVLTSARGAVQKLEIEPFLTAYLGDIAQRLLDCEREAADAPVNANMIFVASALPIINGVIHIASDRERIGKAITHVQQSWKKNREFNPISVLSALILIDVVNRIWQNRNKQPPPGDLSEWKSIMERMRVLGEEVEKD